MPIPRSELRDQSVSDLQSSLADQGVDQYPYAYLRDVLAPWRNCPPG